MSMKIRWVSVVQRKLRAVKERKRILRDFADGRELQRRLAPPAPAPAAKKLLVIRLDDIGDYLLFRNQLAMYKRSAHWQDYSVTLLGNSSWKPIFDACDAAAVDDTLWVDKSKYLADDTYKMEIWARLRAGAFETVIAPSRTRPLVLDDLCMLAAAPTHTIGCINTYVHPQWNRVSDVLYQRLFEPLDTTIHEFHFNAQFAAAICGIRDEGTRPHIDTRLTPPLPQPYIICFVGANTRSKLWPVHRWIEFINLYLDNSSDRVIVAGASPAEIATAALIERHTAATSIAGKASLCEFLGWVAGARAVITNDTMAAHLGASCDKPTVIVANGVNFRRFTEYAAAGIERVATVYPQVFLRKRRRNPRLAYNYTDAVSADMASITAATVYKALEPAGALTPTP